MISCPRCQSRLPEEANFCPYCGYHLRPLPSKGLWWLAALAGGFFGAGAFFFYQFLKERRLWSGQAGPTLEKNPEIDDEELMDF